MLGNKQTGENGKYEDNLENLYTCQKYRQRIHEKEVASLFWKLKPFFLFFFKQNSYLNMN